MTVRNRAQLNSDADTNLPNNTTGAVSPADVRQSVKDLADSALLPEDIAWTKASSSGPAALAFAEDTDNGAHAISLKAPASVAANADVVLPATAGTLATLGGTETFINKTLEAPILSTTILATGIISPPQITAQQNDYAPTGYATATTFRLSTNGEYAITGIAGGVAGRILILHNTSSFQIYLAEQDGSSVAANQIITLGGQWATIFPGSSVMLQYDGTSSRWRILSVALSPGNQANMEAATAGDKIVTPNIQHFHPSAAKCWGEFQSASTTILASYNITSIANTGAGVMTVTIANDFSSANWGCLVSRSEDDMTLVYSATYDAKTAGTVVLRSVVEAGSGSNPSSGSGNASWSMVGYGDL